MRLKHTFVVSLNIIAYYNAVGLHCKARGESDSSELDQENQFDKHQNDWNG